VARKRKVWILAGSLAESGPQGQSHDRPYNTSILLDPMGNIAATYRKIHLFDIAIEDGPADRESDRVTAGDRAVVAEVEGTKIGLSICYDLRFPELYRALAVAGAEILAVPANFLERTGRDHWEVLLRARAIENGAYVIAPAQVGGSPGFPAHGHSMIIDPWGMVMAQAPDEVSIIHATLDLDRVASIRRQIPVLANRHLDAIGRIVGR
jgi:predicted amidohydrolase